MPEQLTPHAATLVELLRGQADRLGDQVAFSYRPDGDDETDRLTYRQLDTRARAIAADLIAHGAAGRPVLVICRPGLDGIAGLFGCCYAGAIAVPVDDHWVSQRMAAVVPDTGARHVLATDKSRAKWRVGVDALTAGAPPHWLELAEPAADPAAWRPPATGPADIAFLQYTSGSTGAPKGVVLSHHNVLTNLEGLQRVWQAMPGAAPETPAGPAGADNPITGVSWLPAYQQMGLVGAILGCVYIGGSNVLMSPGSFLIRPMRWLEAMSRFAAAIGPAPNFAYDWCVRRSSPAQRAALDLSHWRVAVTGGEPVHAETLRAFTAAFAPAGFQPSAFVPVYGQAEVTLAVSGGSTAPEPVLHRLDRDAFAADRVAPAAPDDPAALELLSCGRPRGHEVLIVDPETRTRCAPDRVGEIWIAGPSVGQGYWANPAATERAFGGLLATGEGPYLRTGDLGFFAGDELVLAGRLSDLVTIDGYHHYPNDIEATVTACHPALLPGRAAVFTATPDPAAGEALVVAAEIQRHRDRDTDFAAVIEAVRTAVRSQHGLTAHAVLLVKPMRLPTTATGKIQRGATRQAFLDGDLAVLADRQELPPLDPQTARARRRVAGGLGTLLAGAFSARRDRTAGPRT